MEGPHDILGHGPILARLDSALAQGRIHHAYLFEGPRGVGKRTVAQRFAMAANCEAESGRPCGSCSACRLVLAGNHPDVLVLSPDPSRASGTIAIDEVREIVRQTGYRRYTGRRRVVIVDPAEAMQAPAANALLKTLEEPPEGTGFVLVSHNASALLPTILSRCQRIRFGAVPHDQLANWLRERGHGETAHAAARLAQGCPGRALELVEGGLDGRLELRTRLFEVLGGRLPALFDWSAELTGGKRQDWREDVELLARIVEDLLRDVVVVGSGSDVPLLEPELEPVLRRWAGVLWPDGVEVCRRAIEDLRADLEVNVTGKTALDAFLTRLATELGPARRVA